MTRARKSLQELYALRFRLWRELINLGDFVRGTVVVLRRPCTREHCGRCDSGERHPAIYLSVSQKGRTRLVYLPQEAQGQARQWVKNYRDLMALIEKVSEVNREIVRQVAQRKSQRARGED